MQNVSPFTGLLIHTTNNRQSCFYIIYKTQSCSNVSKDIFDLKHLLARLAIKSPLSPWWQIVWCSLIPSCTLYATYPDSLVGARVYIHFVVSLCQLHIIIKPIKLKLLTGRLWNSDPQSFCVTKSGDEHAPLLESPKHASSGTHICPTTSHNCYTISQVLLFCTY